MPRPRKCRRICEMPRCRSFGPIPATEEGELYLSLDEYEVIRLMDLEALTQEQCAEQMAVARTTVQSIYASARKKLAESLIRGIRLRIEGGDVKICQEKNRYCGAGSRRKYASLTGGQTMKVAVCYDDGKIFQHFGHTEVFKIYKIESGLIVETEICDTNGNGHGALAELLREEGVDTLICGGIGMGAQNALKEAGIRFFGGVEGEADQAVDALIAGTLVYNPNVMCSHHSDHEAEHHCGGHHGKEEEHCGGSCHA